MNNNQEPEVLEAIEIPLEEVIDKTLVKHNVTEQVLTSLKEKYGSVRLKSVEDKESYLEVCEARKSVRSVGIIVEKLCKKGREQAVREQKIWLSKEKEILSKIDEVQKPLDDDIKRFEEEEERKELAEKKKREEVFINRQSELSRLGATYIDGNYVSNHISYELELLKQADEDMWNDTILPKYKKVFEEKEVARVAEENKRKEEAELLRKQQEEFAEQQRLFKEQQEQLLLQQKQLQEQKDEADRQQRLLEQQAEEEKQSKIRNLVHQRVEQIGLLGFKGDGRGAYYFGDSITAITVLVEDIKSMEQGAWDDFISSSMPAIEQVKEKQRAEKEKADLLRDRCALLEAVNGKLISEIENMDNVRWTDYYNDQKGIYDSKKQAEWLAQQREKKEQEDIKKQQEMELSSDKEKYAEVVKYLKAMPVFAFKSNMYKGKINSINDFIADL